MQQAQERLLPFLVNVKQSGREIGETLLELEPEVGGMGVDSLMRWVSDECGLSLASQRVWFRVAKGTLPAAVTDTKTPHSILEHMSHETATKTLESNLPVIDSVYHRLVSKKWSEMTRRECASYITPCGHIPPSHERPEERYKTLHATDLALDSSKKRILATVSTAHVIVSIPLSRVQELLA